MFKIKGVFIDFDILKFNLVISNIKRMKTVMKEVSRGLNDLKTNI